MNTETDEAISQRFKGGHRPSYLGNSWSWILCQYEYYGITNYIELSRDYRLCDGYRLLVYTESGFIKPFVAGIYDDDDVLRLIEGFPPTKPSFKTDRK